MAEKYISAAHMPSIQQKTAAYTAILPIREGTVEIALRLLATAKRILSELPEIPCAKGDLRHRNPSFSQRLRRLLHEKYSFCDAPLSCCQYSTNFFFCQYVFFTFLLPFSRFFSCVCLVCAK